MAIRRVHNQAVRNVVDYEGLSSDNWTTITAAASIGSLRYLTDTQATQILNGARAWVTYAGPGSGSGSGSTPGTPQAFHSANSYTNGIAVDGVGNVARKLVGVGGFVVAGGVICYLKLYDKATAPTAADTPKQIYPLGFQVGDVGGAIPKPSSAGMQFALGLWFRITHGITDADVTYPAVDDAIVDFEYV